MSSTAEAVFTCGECGNKVTVQLLDHGMGAPIHYDEPDGWHVELATLDWKPYQTADGGWYQHLATPCVVRCPEHQG